jgi:hypothetical protein
MVTEKDSLFFMVKPPIASFKLIDCPYLDNAKRAANVPGKSEVND